MNRWIIHFDANSFFAACEQARDVRLRGLPVVVGKERGMSLAVSKEAKDRGVVRGMPIFEARRICPELVVLPTDFVLYEEYSRRMASIASDYVDMLEQYSIDECFLLTSVPYCNGTVSKIRELARSIQKDIEETLDIRIAVGVAGNHVRAKMASKVAKKLRLVVAPKGDIDFLKDISIENVWGVGRSTVPQMLTLSIENAYDFVNTPLGLIRQKFSAPIESLWLELNDKGGVSSFVREKDAQSVQRTRLFEKPTFIRSEIESALSYHGESIGEYLRGLHMAARFGAVILKTKKQIYQFQFEIPQFVSQSSIIVKYALESIKNIKTLDVPFIGSGIILHGLIPEDRMPANLFGKKDDTFERWKELYDVINNNERIKGCLSLASSLLTNNNRKKSTLFPLIYMGEVH